MIRYIVVFDPITDVTDISGVFMRAYSFRTIATDGSELVPSRLQRWCLP